MSFDHLSSLQLVVSEESGKHGPGDEEIKLKEMSIKDKTISVVLGWEHSFL